MNIEKVIIYSFKIKDKSTDDILNHYRSYLDETDINKMKKFKFELNQKQSLASSILKKKYVGHNIYLNEFGKPLSDNFYFNISHCDDYVLMAKAKKYPVGIDIEHILNNVSIEMIDYVCSNEEKANLDKANIYKSFYDLWTKKEAILKCMGIGLTNNLKDVLVNNKYYLDTYYLDDYVVSLAIDIPTNTKIELIKEKEYE